MPNRLTKYNAETGEYEYRERAKTQAEFIDQRKAVIQRLGEYEDKASDVAEEIFAELEKAIDPYTDEYGIMLTIEPDDFAELKKKYIGKDTNVTTKEREKDNGN